MFFPSRQILALLLCAGLWIALVGQLQHALSPWGLGLAAAGVLVVRPALQLDFGVGLTTVFLSGLWLDASAPPEAFGRMAFLLSLAFCLVRQVRARLPRESALAGTAAAMLVNLALFVVAVLTGLSTLPDVGAGALRLLLDLVLGQVLTALAAPWFFALQTASLELIGARPSATARPLG